MSKQKVTRAPLAVWNDRCRTVTGQRTALRLDVHRHVVEDRLCVWNIVDST